MEDNVQQKDSGVTVHVPPPPTNTSDQGGSHRNIPLQLAALKGDLRTAKTLVEMERWNPLYKDSGGNNALHYAAAGGSLEVLKYFIEEGYNPSCLNQDGATPLHLACQYGHFNIVKYLITDQQVDPLCQDKEEMSPFHYACKGGNLSIAQLLVNAMGYLSTEYICNEKTQHGATPLHIASLNSHLNIVKYLVTNLKANPLCKDKEQWTPLHYACQEGNISVVRVLVNEMSKHMPIEDILNERTAQGGTPLHIVSELGHLDIVKYFVSELNCDPNIPDTNSAATPLHQAAYGGQLQVVKYLVFEQKCDPMSTNVYKNTPVHYAASNGQLRVVKFFMEDLNCPINLRGYCNLTVSQQAHA